MVFWSSVGLTPVGSDAPNKEVQRRITHTRVCRNTWTLHLPWPIQFSAWLTIKALPLHGGWERKRLEGRVFACAPTPSAPCPSVYSPPSYGYMTYLKMSVIAYGYVCVCLCWCVHVSINTDTWEVANVHCKHKTLGSGHTGTTGCLDRLTYEP